MARILLIDDDELVRGAVREILTFFGHAVTEATNGREAIRLFGKVGADLLITDILMPEQDGIEVLLTFRKSHPPVQIIAISGGGLQSADEYLHLATLLGAARVLAKPFSTEALINAVNEVLPVYLRREKPSL